MDAAAVITVYRFAHVALERNLEGLIDPEALARVDALLGLEPAWPASLGSSEPYRRGSFLGKAGAIA